MSGFYLFISTNSRFCIVVNDWNWWVLAVINKKNVVGVFRR